MYGKNSSFIDLFEDRIEKIPGEYDFASVKPIVDIFTGTETVEKKFGPFDMIIPKFDDIRDMYKFIVYTQLINNFSLQSGQRITKIGAKVLTFKKRLLKQMPMMRVQLCSRLLSKYGKVKSRGLITCVIDFIWDQVKGKPGFRSYTYEKLKAEIMSYATIDVLGLTEPQLCTEDIINWAKECHPNVSIHGFDMTYTKFASFRASTKVQVSLVFIAKDRHCFPITDEQLKTIATKANQGGASNILKYMIEERWSRRSENVHKLTSIDQVTSHGKENTVIILPEDAKIEAAIELYCRQSGFYVDYLHWNNNGVMDGFIDDKNNMYVLYDDYDTRESINKKLFEMYKIDDFIWTNQTYTKLATSLFQQICGQLQESCYNVNTREIIDDYSPRALQWCSTEEFPKNMVNFDICKCYPSVLLNNEYKIPVYDIHDAIVPFKGADELYKIGEFIIDETIVKINGASVRIEAGIYNSNLVQFLVQELKMPLTQIKRQLTTKKYIAPDTFKKFINYVFDEFPEAQAKMMVNAFIGGLGRKYSKSNAGFTSNDYDTVMGCWTKAMADGRNLSIDEFNGIFFVKEQHCQRLFSNSTSVNRFVISHAALQLLQLIQATVGKESKLMAYNTDGIFITNPKIRFPHKKSVKFETKNIGKAYMTDSELKYFEKKYREDLDMEGYEIVTGTGEIVNGQAGSGKTTELCKRVAESERPLVLTFTNKAIENVKERLRKMKNNKHDPNKICHTCDSYFCEWNEDNFKELRKKTVFIEEYSMVPNKWMTLIYKAFVMYGIEVYMFGDPNQCEPVEGESHLIYNYNDSVSVRQMCPNNKTLPYIEESCRYDRKTHKILATFLKHGKVAGYFEPIGNFYKNICFKNTTRKAVNERCCDKSVKGKDFMTVQFKYNGGRESYKICKEMPLLATQNLKDDGVFNTMEFKLEDIRWKGGQEFKVNEKW